MSNHILVCDMLCDSVYTTYIQPDGSLESGVSGSTVMQERTDKERTAEKNIKNIRIRSPTHNDFKYKFSIHKYFFH